MRGLGREIWKNVDADAYVRSLRSGWDEPPANVEEAGLRAADKSEIWRRLIQYQGAEFKTTRGLAFTHRVEGDSGIWFSRQGKLVNMRLSRRELEEALQLLPVHG